MWLFTLPVKQPRSLASELAVLSHAHVSPRDTLTCYYDVLVIDEQVSPLQGLR